MDMKRFFELVLKLAFIFIICPIGLLFLGISSSISKEQGECLSFLMFGLAALFSIWIYREELIVTKMELGRFQPVESFFRTFGC